MNLTNNYRVNLWGTRFGTELWESLTRATRRDEIQKVSSEIYYRIHKANIKLLVVILYINVDNIAECQVETALSL